MRQARAQLPVLFRRERLRREARDEHRVEACGGGRDAIAGAEAGAALVTPDVWLAGAPGTMSRTADRSGAGGGMCAGGVGMSIVIGTVAAT